MTLKSFAHIAIGTTLTQDEWEAASAHEGGVGRGATYVVAASDAADHVKQQADYECDGTADDVEIQAAIDAIEALGAGVGGKVILSDGKFNITSKILITNDGLTLAGQGMSASRIEGNSAIDFIETQGDRTTFQDFRVNGFGSANPTGGIVVNGGRADFYGVEVRSFAANPAIIIKSGSTLCYLYGVKILNCLKGIQFLSLSHGCKMFGGSIITNVADATLVEIDNTQQIGLHGVDLEGLQASTVAVSINTTNSECNFIDCRFENLLTGISWSDGNNDVILGGNFASTTTVLSSKPATSKVHFAKGYVTENSGTATIANGNTSATVSHGLAVTPTLDDISVVMGENPTNDPGNIWVDTITSTQFNINCRNDPGASGLDVAWRAVVL